MSSIAKPTDLLDVINWASTECVNASSSSGLENALKQGLREDEGLLLESDEDEQLLIHVAFNAAIKLQSIVIQGPEDGAGAKDVKLFVNRPTIGFSEAEDEPGIQALSLTAAEVKGKATTLRVAKFQSVSTLTIFISSNQDGQDVTRVTKLALFGNPVQGMDVSSIKKDEPM